MKRNKEQMNSDPGFFEPNAIKEQREKDKPKDGKNSPWDFRCPQYDQRSSNFINAGTHYGNAINQPIGHKGNPKNDAKCFPKTGVNTMVIDDQG